ncbi:hypothetical protein [Erythrobacter sp.]|uniref:hypothetical protein n=1 Tax=Erythrobacter sp. TaxID=1042 RepID=UPI0025DFDB85|nr:hypothetical protein [Erythrobacter sp.]
MRKLLIGIVLLGLLVGAAVYAGLANPVLEWRVKSALVEAGIGEARAECMAGRMVERLSPAQLWNLQQGMAALADEPAGGYSLGELVKRLDRVGDGEAVAVLTTSAGLCALGVG